MAKKQTPAWRQMGLDGPPPVVRGYHDYGVVHRATDGPQREPLSYSVRLGIWSWSYWGRKVRKDIEAYPATGAMRLAQLAVVLMCAVAERANSLYGVTVRP